MQLQSNKTFILTGSDVQELVRHFGPDRIMLTLIERLRLAIRHYDPQQVSIPVRGGFHYDKPQPGLIEWMPFYNQQDEAGKVLIKIVGYHPSNPRQLNLPTIVSTISEYDTRSGHLCSVIDGGLATALRTGAASAVASKLMAAAGSTTLGLIGCGAQAITQLHAISLCFKIQRVLFYDINEDIAASFTTRCAALNLQCEFIPTDITSIVNQSDIICTATSIDIGAGPLFSNCDTHPHVHINAVGSDFPGKIEIPLALLQKSFVCPDFLEQAIVEGECQQLEKQQIGASLYEVAQQPNKYAYLQQQRTVFDSTGWALEDKVVMDLLVDCASELGLGKELDIEQITADTRNPYHFLSERAIAPSITGSHINKAVSLLSALG